MLVCLCGSFMVRMEGVQRKDRVGRIELFI